MKRKLLAAGVVALAATSDALAKVEFTRHEDFAPVTIGTRQRLGERTKMYAEMLTKYGHYQNYLHFWTDRPLFMDRSTQPAKFAYLTPESFGEHVREARRFGLDGLGVFGTYGGRIRDVKQLSGWLADAGANGFEILPLALYGESGIDYTPAPDEFSELVKYAESQAVSARIGEKKLIGIYNCRMYSAAQHDELNRGIRAQVGNSDYLIPNDLADKILNPLRRSFYAKGSLTKEETTTLENAIMGVLDIADGLHLAVSHYRRAADGPYCSRIDTSFFMQCEKPLLESIFARPQYRGKLLGFTILQGYINPHSGMNHGEFGTQSLRDALRAAVSMNPDYLLFFEWNEQNENTMFQPTVSNGESIGRIIRHYADRFAGRAPAPYGDDDPNVPALVLSHRLVFKPGETIGFEILNIPSGEAVREHKVRLSLLDIDGQTLVTFPEEKIATDRFGAVTYDVAGETLPLGSSISAVLTVDGVDYEGFPPIRCDATVCGNYKEARTSLRGLLTPTSALADVRARGDGNYAFGAKLQFNEPVSSIELVGNEEELAAYGSDAAYDLEKNDILLMTFITRPICGGSAPIDIAFEGVPGLGIHPRWQADVNPSTVARVGEGETYRLHTYWWGRETGYYLTFPKGAATNATLTVTCGGKWAGRIAKVSLSTALEKGIAASELDGASGLRVDVRRVSDLPDLPVPANAEKFIWKGKVREPSAAPSFHYRVIAKSGKTWRSRPIQPTRPEGATVRNNYFSESRKRVLSLDVPRMLLPTIAYRFDPSCGAALANTWSPKFNAFLGGGYASGGGFDEAREFKDVPNTSNVPAWAHSDADGDYLAFDGENDYVAFPIETTPQAAFTLRATFRPRLGETNQTLFRHGACWRASLALFLVKGQLVAYWADRALDDPKHSLACFETGLAVKDGEWNDLTVAYDFATMAITLNGKTYRTPFNRRGYVFRPSMFGGHNITVDVAPRGPLSWFKGDLKAFSIQHYCE